MNGSHQKNYKCTLTCMLLVIRRLVVAAIKCKILFKAKHIRKRKTMYWLITSHVTRPHDHKLRKYLSLKLDSNYLDFFLT